jgi:lipopolysaccharide/colanic/teichoic acid biosynthesis glycosyltransferase
MTTASLPVVAVHHELLIPERVQTLHEERRIPMSVRCVKRGIDLLFSSIGLVLLAFLLPLIALAIRIDSPGPIFYRQRRARSLARRDVHGRCLFGEFDMLKFRTMRCDAEKFSGAVLAGANDPRVTRVGRMLRKTRLDELPQLLNVLKGDMSLVGPRPERPELLENLALAIPYFEERLHDTRPGITGFAQVSLDYLGHPLEGSPIEPLEATLTNPLHIDAARGAIADDMRMKLLFDLAYVASLERIDSYLLMELSIIFKTPWIMLRGLGR